MDSWYKMPEALKEQVFNRLEQLASVANLSEADRIAYDRAVDSFRVSLIVEQDTIQRIKQGIEEGMKQGREEGMKKGREEEKYRIARMLKAQGVLTEIISQSTGLTEADILGIV